MTNITLSVDDATLKKARQRAAERDTTLTAMVRDFIRSVAETDEGERQRRVARLEDTFRQFSRDMGDRTWTRENLHER